MRILSVMAPSFKTNSINLPLSLSASGQKGANYDFSSFKVGISAPLSMPTAQAQKSERK